MRTNLTDVFAAAAEAGGDFSDRRAVFCETVFDGPGRCASDSVVPATAKRRSAGPAAFDCSVEQIIGKPEQLGRRPENSYLFILQLSGQSRIAQDEVDLMLAPSEIAILPERRPLHFKVLGSGSRIVLVLPRDMADRRAPWLPQCRASKVMAADSPYADLARQHLLYLAAAGRDLGESATGLLIDNLFNLLTLANAPDAVSQGPRGELALEALLAFCRHNMHEPKLSPHLVAAHFGISVRTLHLRFEKLGQSFKRWLLQIRLDACATALCDPAWRGCTISEVAYRCGFNDLSYFNRAFRARFDATPRGWRVQPTAQ